MGFWIVGNISARQRKMTKFFLDGLFVRVLLLPFCTKLKMETMLISTEQKIFQITWKIAEELLHPHQLTIISKVNRETTSLLWIKFSEFWLFSSNLLCPGSGFIWVTWVQGQQKWPSFISALWWNTERGVELFDLSTLFQLQKPFFNRTGK